MVDKNQEIVFREKQLAYARELGDRRGEGKALFNLGNIYAALGDYVGARPYYEQALAIRRKVLGEEHPDTATSLNNLGRLLEDMGDYAGARPYFEQALAICRKVLGKEHPDTRIARENLERLKKEMKGK
jgi:tetratricopeptide (TPR) repeat protein